MIELNFDRIMTVGQLRKQILAYEGDLDEPVMVSDHLGGQFFLDNEAEADIYTLEEPINSEEIEDPIEYDDDWEPPLVEGIDYTDYHVFRLNASQDPYK